MTCLSACALCVSNDFEVSVFTWLTVFTYVYSLSTTRPFEGVVDEARVDLACVEDGKSDDCYQ